jgi:transposase
LDERRQNVNNDQRDARALAQRLDRYVAGNLAALATVRVPTPEEEQRRIQSRQREQLRREVHRVGAQGRSLLLSQGYRQQGRWWQQRCWSGLLPRLPAWLTERLEVFRRMLAILEKELAAATTALEAQAPQCRPRGLGGLTYRTLEAEIGDWSRFNNRRQVASYTGLCGGVSASGQYQQLLSITKHGNVRMRTALIELAWRWVHWQSQCALVQRWSRVLYAPKATRAARKKAIVAIARQLAVDCGAGKPAAPNPNNSVGKWLRVKLLGLANSPESPA